MNDRSLADSFYIEDHALLFGLLGREAEEQYGEAGLSALKKATILYGKERGLRMAMRAIKNGDSLSPENYIIYSEWKDDRGMSLSKVEAISPEYRTKSLRCGWCDTWQKYDLMRYGRIYCAYIDKSLVKGFCPDNELELSSKLSEGSDCCDFHWVGADFRDEAGLSKAMMKKASMESENIKDFLYHCGHLLSALRRTFLLELGLVKGQQIVDRALSSYADIMGEDKRQALEDEGRQDFLSV